MPNRSRDRFAQAEHDLEQAIASHEDGRHDRACFAAHQGPAFEHYGSLHSSQAVEYARNVLDYVRKALADT